MFDNFQAWFVVTVQKLVCHSTTGVLIGELKRLGTKPLYTADSNKGVG